ncbi:MAG: Chaperone protein DnaK [Firmicutes bacterium]|nr:Chaperone protein DnaK [Bacillota bacterium]
MSRIIGIDLGTSTSEVAILENGKPMVIKNREGDMITPSVVGINGKGEIIAGREAKDQYLLRPRDTVIEVKRLMGSGRKVKMGDKEYTPEEISSHILKYLKGCAEDYLGEPATRAVITVPAYFTDEQRRATVEAGRLAGFKVERIINEPTAAALAYGIDHMEDNLHVLVYDLGGGTLDVTVLEMFEGVLEVKASSGNNRLGGKDFDERLMKEIIRYFEDQTGVDISEDPRAAARLKNAVEECKIALSSQIGYRIELPLLAEKDGSPLALEKTVSRNEFENLIRDLVESTRQPIEAALKDAGLEPQDIDIVLPVGGSTRIPLVMKFLKEVLGQEPRALVDPDLAVASGAAIQAGILADELSAEKDILITDVCPYTLGTEVLSFFGGFPVDDVYDIIIPRNTTIPVTRKKVYGTVADNQQAVDIKVYQGDYKKASRNNLLGKFTLSGIPPAPAFTEKIEIGFTYDANGILQVEGTILSNGQRAGLTIETAGVEMEPELDLGKWKEAPGARKYRGLIRRAEKALKAGGNQLFEGELDELVRDIKKALLKGESNRLKELEEELTDLLYDLEDTDE